MVPWSCRDRVWGPGFRVQGVGLRIWDLRLGVEGQV